MTYYQSDLGVSFKDMESILFYWQTYILRLIHALVIICIDAHPKVEKNTLSDPLFCLGMMQHELN